MNRIIYSVLTILLVSCMSTKSVSNANTTLFDKKWVLVSLKGSYETIPTTMKEVFIQFAEDRVNGQSGCNNYFGGYTIDKNKLQFKELGSTMMACMDESMKVETKFHEMMKEVNQFKLENGNLQFYKDDHLLAIFK